MRKILITGAAGFIGFFLAKRLLKEGNKVFGVDNLNNYYDVNLKKDRLSILKEWPYFSFACIDLSDRHAGQEIFNQENFDIVIHLAAQAGVRYSLENPFAYCDSNLTDFMTMLEGCRQTGVDHFIFASSSSVYGANSKVPFSVTDNVDHPVSLYAATKKANELMAHSYSHLYKIPTTGLRFFTVYGPWGRPDMAYFKFIDAISQDKPIQVYNYGDMKRDFTYIDDVIESIIRLISSSPVLGELNSDSNTSNAPYKIFNVGNHSPVKLLDFIEVIEEAIGKVAKKVTLPMQPGDVPVTYADVDDLIDAIGFRPKTSIEEGIYHFVK